jgi:hypothetical protein
MEKKREKILKNEVDYSHVSKESVMSRYEEMRCSTLNSGHSSECQGLAVFLNGGMARWLDIWKSTKNTVNLLPTPMSENRETNKDVENQIISILTDMALKERRAI